MDTVGTAPPCSVFFTPFQGGLTMKISFRPLAFFFSVVLAIAVPVLLAQISVPTFPIEVDTVTTFTSPSSTQEELPGLGHKFELLGSMVRDSDPDNPVGNSGNSGGGGGGNEVISAITTPTTMAFAYRNLPPGIKIAAFDNQLGLKYFFVAPKTCNAGSPRLVLFVDADGDGDRDFSANGHVNPPLYTACPQNRWVYQDMTDDLPRWEVTPGSFASQLGIPTYPYSSWDTFESAVTAAFPNHRVYAGFLLDGESCSFSPLNCGKAYYDLVTIENRTLEIWQDTVKNN
jgi:hypothetical protein